MDEITGNVLIVDDDHEICKALGQALQSLGHDVMYTHKLEDGLQEIASESYDVVFLDVCLPDGNGLSALSRIEGNGSRPEIIIMTGRGEPEGAELAIKSGAWDYIEKPFHISSLVLPLKRALQYRREKHSLDTALPIDRENLIGNSPRFKHCMELLSQASQSDANILITGETGTGKELFASAIHNNSSRKDRNFVIVDCTSLPETLVESVLFGHEKGAFTGAEKARDGLVKQADGGTLFLDEVGELPLNIQKSFLRVLQERKCRPIGGKREIKSDFRLIVATNRNLDQMVKEGKFRHDLMFRIRSLVIDLPPLRDRKEDIKKLTLYFIKRICKRYHMAKKEFSPEFLGTLTEYNWPGNVRELINSLEYTMSKARYEPTLFPKHLPVNLRANVVRSSLNKKNGIESHPLTKVRASSVLPTMKAFRATVLADNEKRYLEELVSLTSGNIKEACQISGLGRARLYDLMKTYGIPRNNILSP